MGILEFLGHVMVYSHRHRQNIENRTVPESLRQGMQEWMAFQQDVPSQGTTTWSETPP